MPVQSWVETLIRSKVDGPTITAAAATGRIPDEAIITLPANFFAIGKQILVRAAGRISCAVTTPGTARFDLRLGGTVVFDSLAMNLNIVAKTNVAWLLDILLTCRAEGSGTDAKLFGQGSFTSEAGILAPLPSVGSNAIFTIPYASAPAVGGGFNSTAALALDMFFTQTEATGSLTVHQYAVQDLG